MALSWSSRRQFLYYAVALVVAVVLFFILWQTFFTAQPTCQDGIQNGSEAGIDCGGACALLCEGQARSPVVLWSRTFETAPSFYTAATYIQNPNPGVGAKNVPYSLQLFDEKNLLVMEREGMVDLPPIGTIPLVETNIGVGNRTVARAIFAFTSPPVWNKVPAGTLPQLRITQQSLAQDGTRLSATIVNDSLDPIRSLDVAAVVFDSAGVARAASKTRIDNISAKSSEPLIFTWPSALTDVARAEITVLPSF